MESSGYNSRPHGDEIEWIKFEATKNGKPGDPLPVGSRVEGFTVDTVEYDPFIKSQLASHN